MLIYVIYFIMLSVLALEYEVRPFKSKVIPALVVLMLSLLAGLRSIDVSRDYIQYQFAFDNIYDFVKDPSGVYFGVFEPGFVGISLLFRLFFTQNYGVAIMLFFAFSSLTIKCFSFFRLSLNPYLLILLYYSYFFILHEMTQVRIGLASGIFLISLIFLLQKKYKAYIGLVLLATLFHYSAILYLVLLPVNSKSFNKYFYYGVIAFSMVLGIVKLSFSGYFTSYFAQSDSFGKASTYADVISYGVAEQINFFNVVNILKIVISLYLIYSIPVSHFAEDPKLTLFLKLNIFSIFIFAAFAGEPFVAFRMGELFGIIYVFTFAYLAKYLPFERLNIFAVLLLAILLFYLNFFHEDLLKPYELIKIV